MKLLILAMSCDLPFFVKSEEVVKSTWAKKIIDGKYPDVDFYIIRASENERIENNYIYVNTGDSFYETFDKTTRAFELLNEKEIKYDFILRTNLSTYVNVNALLNVINSYIIPNCFVKNFFGGELLQATVGQKETYFFRGNFMLFNRLQIKFLLQNKNKYLRTVETDDSLIGKIFDGYFVFQSLKYGILNKYAGYSAITTKLDDIDQTYVYVSYRYCFTSEDKKNVEGNSNFEYDVREKEFDICKQIHKIFTNSKYNCTYEDHLLGYI